MKKNYVLIIGVLAAIFICSNAYNGLQSDRINSLSFEEQKEKKYKNIPARRKKYIHGISIKRVNFI